MGCNLQQVPKSVLKPFSLLPSVVLTKHKQDNPETKSSGMKFFSTELLPNGPPTSLPGGVISFHVHKADVHDKQCVSGQWSGRWGQHFHHLCLRVHISHHNEATHRALHYTLPSTFLPVLGTAHAQHVIREVSPWCHRHQLKLCVILRHSKWQARVRDGWCPDLVDADV